MDDDDNDGGIGEKYHQRGHLPDRLPAQWNSLPRNICDTPTLKTFNSKSFHYFLNLDVNLHVCSVRQS